MALNILTLNLTDELYSKYDASVLNSISTFYHWVGISAGGLFQTPLYFWVCQMLHETSFQISNMYSIGD